MPMPSANGNITIMDKEFGINSKKTHEELKRQVAKLKTELESERTKLKQVHRDKTAELKRIQDNHEKERHRTVESITKRLQTEHAVEIRRLRENLSKEKDNELRQVLKFKDEELKALKQQVQEEKERSKRADDDIKRLSIDKNRESSHDVEERLRNDLDELREQKRKLEEQFKLKCAADYEKAELIRRLKNDHEREVNALIRESKREVAKEFQHLRSAEKALEEKNHELAFKDQLTKKLEAEKQQQRKTSVDSNLSESPFRSRLGSGETSLSELPGPEEVFQSSPKGRFDKERELRKKNAELQSRLDQLEKKCSMLEKENSSRHTSGSQKVSEEKVKKLKKRNTELVAIARQLEEKAKQLQDEKNTVLKQANSKADPSAEVEHMKKMFARQRAKDLAEQAKCHLQKDNEIESLHKEIETLSKNKPQHQNDKVDELQAIIKKTAKERLVLEKKLAGIESPNSTPLHSGSKSKTTPDSSIQLEKELEMKEKECENLKKSADEMRAKCSKMEVERERFAAKCTMLHQKNAELGKRMKELNKVEEEIITLKDNLQKAEQQRHNLEQDCLKLREQLKDLMHVKQDLETSEKQRKILEREHVTSSSRLKEREEEIRQLHKIQEESTRSHRLAVTSLENDVRALQQKCADSNDRANNLKNELEKLKTTKTSNHHKATQTSPWEPAQRHESSAVREKGREAGNDESDDVNKDILDVAALRIKQLEMSDSEEDSLRVTSQSKDKPLQADDDDIASLSRRISQVTYSDDSTSVLDDNDDSEASRDVNSMAEGDLADMEDNDVTTSMIDGDETGNDSRNYLDSNQNVSKEIKNLEKRDTTSGRESPQEDVTIDEKYLTSEHDSESDSDIDEENLAVFIARYSYDPYQHSPNDCPEAELAFQAGDYLYVFGDVDEDGFYLGELMDGQRGLVPSNFVEKIADESELPWIVNGGQEENADDLYGSDEENEERKLHRNLRLNVEHIPDSKLCDIEEEEDGEASREALNSSHDGFRSDDTDLEPVRIPSPKHVVLERQHTKSIVINWKPADLPADEVKGYGVYVNGQMKMMVKGGKNTKALVEDIDPSKTYRISVRTITVLGDESHDQEATLTIGKDASVAPSNLQVSDVTPTSAKIEWLPGNSSYSHDIIVDGTLLRTIKPGTYQHSLTNLEPKQHYRVHVRAVNPNIFIEQDSKDIDSDSLAKAVEFTTQEGGAPDPPLNVHLVPMTSRSGPNTLEVSWIPVTINKHGTSNGARVTGYKAYINDVTCAEVTSSTADCVTVASWMIERAVKKTKAETVRLTVRTQSSLGESVPSNIVSIPLHTFNFNINKLIGAQPMGTPVKAKHDKTHPVETPVEATHQDELEHQENSLETKQGDKNHPVRTPVGTKHGGTLVEEEDKEKERNKERSDEKPVAKPRQESLVPPIPKARTKGKPKLWLVDIDDDDSYDDSNRSGGNSTVDEDEQVEICNRGTTDDIKIPADKYDHSPTTNTDTGKAMMTKQPVMTKEERCKIDQEPNDYQHQATKEGYSKLGNESTPLDNDNGTDNEDKSTSEAPERKISGLSDIDVDELTSSLKSATSYKRKSKSKTEPKEPFLTPVDLSGSELGDSSDESLSVIDEEDEENEIEEVEDSANKRSSRSSRTHSATDSFRSEDDVMDLLGEDSEDDTHVKPLTAANIRKFSREQEQKDEQEPASDSEHAPGLLKYLVTTEEVGGNNDSGHEEDVKNLTYSDVEADQFEPSGPYETSTPTMQRKSMEDEHSLQDDATTDDATNRTYTLEDHNQLELEQDQGEELVRIFIALYDYNPAIQSPNPDAEEEELAFNEGDLIKIYGDTDPDGFYWGEMDGHTGFVPHNMVSEVQLDEDDLLDESPSPESQANEYAHLHNGEPINGHHTNRDPNQQLHEHHDDNVPNQEYPHHAVEVPRSDKYVMDTDPNQEYYDENVPSNEYGQDNVPRDNLPVDGTRSQYPTVVVHKPSDASLHEPSFQAPDDLNPVPHDISNETYNISQGGDDSMEFEDPRNSLNYSLDPKKMVALFDYDPQMLSPNPDSEVELKFRSGDILYVYGEMDEDGFYTGEVGGVRGLVPSNFLEDYQDTSISSQPPSQDPSDISVVSEESAPGPSKTPNGTQSPVNEAKKKKTGIFSKGKKMFKKMTNKSQTPKK